MQVARYQSLRRQAAGHGDNLDIQSFVLIESQLFGDEMWIIDNSKTRKRNADIFKLGALRVTPSGPKQENR